MIELRVLGRTELRAPGSAAADELLGQTRPTALLVYLAVAQPGDFKRRDHLVGLFWAETDQEHARANLRKLLHALRRALGEGLVETRGDEELRLDPSALWCDAAELEACVQGRLHARTIQLYHGPLLPGFLCLGAHGFQAWLDLTRRRFAREAVKSALILAEEHATRRERTLVGDMAQFIVQREPDLADEHQLRKLISLLARTGDRSGALRLYETFRERLWLDLAAEPDAETQALARSLRRR